MVMMMTFLDVVSSCRRRVGGGGGGRMVGGGGGVAVVGLVIAITQQGFIKTSLHFFTSKILWRS